MEGVEESVYLEVSGDLCPQISLGWTEPSLPITNKTGKHPAHLALEDSNQRASVQQQKKKRAKS